MCFERVEGLEVGRSADNGFMVDEVGGPGVAGTRLSVGGEVEHDFVLT